MKKTKDLNFLYNFIKGECAKLKTKTNGEVRAVMLYSIYKAAYEYVKNGGKRNIDKFIETASQK